MIRFVIRSFRDADTKRLHDQQFSRRFVSLERVARRKLTMIDAAVQLEDLRSPPDNRLELLRGNRAGQYSILINSQWRICFIWRDGAAEEVEIVDYH